jgi:MinD superfamily P-loop ATPase
MCPSEAIDFVPKHCGDWYRSTCRFGAMVHAQLFPAEENSGRLVALLRQQARALAEAEGATLILSDGPPGIGCPVISALSGADLAVIVTEPTVSGRHDLERVLELCRHFTIPAGVIINKCDLNLDQATAIEQYCRARDLPLIGRLPHDAAFTQAMVRGLCITEYDSDVLSQAVASAWQTILNLAAPQQPSGHAAGHREIASQAI